MTAPAAGLPGGARVGAEASGRYPARSVPRFRLWVRPFDRPQVGVGGYYWLTEVRADGREFVVSAGMGDGTRRRIEQWLRLVVSQGGDRAGMAQRGLRQGWEIRR